MAANKRKPDQKEDLNGLSKYAYYSGLGFQMIAIIGVFTYLGFKLDEWMVNQRPIYTAVLSLLGVCISLYSVIRSVNKK